MQSLEVFHSLRVLVFSFQLCDVLANEYDMIRKEYWNYVAHSLAQRMKCPEDEATGSTKTD
jgi:hypothetical protein